MSNKKRALGRGLSALLEDADTGIDAGFSVTGDSPATGLTHLSLDKIETNPFQPRTDFGREALLELAGSIKTHGVIQPVTVRKMGYGQYQIIAGERRYRAAALAGLTEIPAYIRVANDQAMLELALVENIQRKDLDAIEIAISYQRLIEECKLTQEELSKKVSKQRPTITNYLRLLKLPAEIQRGIRQKKITMGHARALVNIGNEEIQLAIYRKAIEEGLSVREVEKLAKSGRPKPVSRSLPPQLSFEQQKIQEELSELFEKHIELKPGRGGKGKIVIPFNSDSDLQRIIDVIT